MIVKLAGFNVDLENILQLKEVLTKHSEATEIDIQALKKDIDVLKKIEWTPETLSASYARISRDPRSIEELRVDARAEIDKARRSNQAIIFDMGHSSVAEHAVFNIDIIDISRLLAEKLEKARIVSFTEKSQRYIKIGNDNYYPHEFESDPEFNEKYKNLCSELFEAYNFLHDGILPYFLDKHKDIKPEDKEYRDIVNLAKEDARYVLPLATLTQVGMTVNARSLEKIIRKLLSGNISESHELGKKIFEVVDGVAPSLVKYTEPTSYEKETYRDLKELIGNEKVDYSLKEVVLINHEEDIEDKILAAFIVKTTDIDYRNARAAILRWDDEKKRKVFYESIKHLSVYDSVLREYELSGFEFNILLSATAFAQLKRHRMATIIDGEYSPQLDVKIPDSIVEAGQKDFFMDKIGKINTLYYEAKDKWSGAADYILSNAHRKNIILKCNFRELVHIARLRTDKHAQWDIRNLSVMMLEEVQAKLEIIGALLCAKEEFSGIKKDFNL